MRKSKSRVTIKALYNQDGDKIRMETVEDIQDIIDQLTRQRDWLASAPTEEEFVKLCDPQKLPPHKRIRATSSDTSKESSHI